MSAEEYALWEAEYQRAPWGEVRADFNAGQICATFFNMQGKVPAEGSQVSALDFMAFVRRASEPVHESDPVSHFKGLNGA